MKRLMLLCDLDDCLWDITTPWCEALNKRYGTTVKPTDITNWDIHSFFPTITQQQLFEVLDEDGFCNKVLPFDDSLWFVNQVLNDGHKLKIVTSSHYNNMKQKMERFLEVFSMLRWSDVVVTADKSIIRGDVLIDDAPHNLENGKYWKILKARPHNESYNAEVNGMVRVDTLMSAYEHIRLLAHENIFQFAIDKSKLM